MERGLVYIGKVTQVLQIPDADKIESLEVICGEGGKWRGTAVKGQFKEGDLCRVFLQDSLVPNTPDFSFMEKNNWRVRMIRLRGVPSEVLIMPLISGFMSYDVGSDITDISGVTKYVKPIPANMAGIVYGDFPYFIPETDEPNFQTVPKMVELMLGKAFYSSIKVDGSSATVYKHDGHFGCCSRKIELKESESNIIWRIARKYNLEDILLAFDYALQFEVAGPSIQKNPLGLSEPKPFLFNIYDISNKCYLPYDTMMLFARNIGFPTVEVIEDDKLFAFTTNEGLQKYAEGKYSNGKQREGVVIRPIIEEQLKTGERVSFKVINLLYKD